MFDRVLNTPLILLLLYHISPQTVTNNVYIGGKSRSTFSNVASQSLNIKCAKKKIGRSLSYITCTLQDPGKIWAKPVSFKVRETNQNVVNNNSKANVMRCTIWSHLYNFKSMKNTHRGVLLLVKLLKVTLLHGTSSRFWNCTDGTKSSKASQIIDRKRNLQIRKIGK